MPPAPPGARRSSFWEDVYKPAPLIAPARRPHYFDRRRAGPGCCRRADRFHHVGPSDRAGQFVDETDLNHVWLGPNGRHHFRQFSRRPSHRQSARDRLRRDHGQQRDDLPGQHLPRFDTPTYVRSGISANVFLLISDRKNVLRIPTDAITPKARSPRRGGGPAAGCAEDRGGYDATARGPR